MGQNLPYLIQSLLKLNNMTTTKKIFVSMTDKFMSGWGKATNKTNKFIVICDNWDQAKIIEQNAEKRPEMKYVNICINKPRYGSNVVISWRNFDELGDIWKQK